MKAQIKELFKLVALGDLKRPPKFLFCFDSPTIKDFSYEFSINPNHYGNKHYFIKLDLVQELFTIKIVWDSSQLNWHLTIIGNFGGIGKHGCLDYVGKYYKFSPEVKKIIDYMCSIATCEYKKIAKGDALLKAAKEINMFREILPKLEELSLKETEIKYDDAISKYGINDLEQN